MFMSCHEPELVAAVTEKAYTIEQGNSCPAAYLPGRDTGCCCAGRVGKTAGSRRRQSWPIYQREKYCPMERGFSFI